MITAWGYDRDQLAFHVSDTEREEILPVPFGSMGKARFCKDAYFDIRGNCYAPETLTPPDNLPEIVRNAILHNSRVLMDGGMEFQGIAALKKWQEELPSWETFEDWKWTARFAYQVIEKRGTGGGGFRKMYAQFLEEAAELLPRIGSMELPERMKAVGLAWRDLALALKSASDGDRPDFATVARKLENVERLEADYHEAVLSLE